MPSARPIRRIVTSYLLATLAILGSGVLALLAPGLG